MQWHLVSFKFSLPPLGSHCTDWNCRGSLGACPTLSTHCMTSPSHEEKHAPSTQANFNSTQGQALTWACGIRSHGGLGSHACAAQPPGALALTRDHTGTSESLT